MRRKLWRLPPELRSRPKAGFSRSIPAFVLETNLLRTTTTEMFIGILDLSCSPCHPIRYGPDPRCGARARGLSSAMFSPADHNGIPDKACRDCSDHEKRFDKGLERFRHKRLQYRGTLHAAIQYLCQLLTVTWQ